MNINAEFSLPKRYNIRYMERLNKRENDIISRRNINSITKIGRKFR